MFLSVTFAFCVYFLLLKNLTTTILVFICVMFVINGSLFAGSMQGWEIGKTELVIIPILIIFSLDNICLMGIEYTESKREFRREKLAQTYKYMGITIVFHWLTIFSIGLMQLGCQLPIGKQLVTVLCLTSSL